jgi:hypothetical protein
MKCTFMFLDDSKAGGAVEFFKSIGMEHLNLGNFDKEVVDIEFLKTPDVLKTYSIDNVPSISNISALGVTFYTPLSPRSRVSTIDGMVDGFVFCPMSNIKVINTLGELLLDRKPT